MSNFINLIMTHPTESLCFLAGIIVVGILTYFSPKSGFGPG